MDGLRGRAACALAAESGRGRQDNSMKNQSTIETETRGGSCDPVTGSAAVEREARLVGSGPSGASSPAPAGTSCRNNIQHKYYLASTKPNEHLH